VPRSDASGFVEVLVAAGKHRLGLWAPGHAVWLTTVDLATDGIIDPRCPCAPSEGVQGK
jgi:hypothetical protein